MKNRNGVPQYRFGGNAPMSRTFATAQKAKNVGRVMGVGVSIRRNGTFTAAIAPGAKK